MKGMYKTAEVESDDQQKKSYDEMWEFYEERAKRRKAIRNQK